MRGTEYIKIGTRRIGPKYKPLIIFELGINHNGNLKFAKKIVDEAIKCGAEVIKHQTHIPEDEMSEEAKKIIPVHTKKNIYDIINSCALNEQEELELKKYIEKKNAIFLSTPFSRKAVDRLVKFKVKAFKIGSGECNNYPLVDYIASFKKPIIISTGIADEKNIATALNICKKNKNFNVILLNCISSYPAKFDELNLNYINVLRKFCPLLGYSDHSTSDLASIISVSKGAKVIEKHFILSKKIRTPDSSFSYDPIEFKNLIKKIRDVEVMLGSENINKKLILKKKLKTVTRSIFYSKNINKGERITLENIKSVRPGTGLNLSYFTKIIGKKVKKSCKFGQPVKLKDITLN